MASTLPAVFELLRHEDESGVSGTGIVAYGVKFGDGTCAVRWSTGGTASTGVFESIADVEEIHGHDGKTEIIFLSYPY